MIKTSTALALLLSANTLCAFDFSSLKDDILNTNTPSQKSNTTPNKSGLSDSLVRDGLKEALKIGVDYGVKELAKKDGYLNNADVKIPLPQKLAKAEGIIRSVGGDKVADDLIESMNSAATQAAPKTASIFIEAVNSMSIDDAKKILSGPDTAATEYFEEKTSQSLSQLIKPIIKKSMEDNNVAKYYSAATQYYSENLQESVENSAAMGMAKSFGADKYLPSQEDENLEDYVTNKAISGLFTMIASKESEIRQDPVAQTTSLLKKVFGE